MAPFVYTSDKLNSNFNKTFIGKTFITETPQITTGYLTQQNNNKKRQWFWKYVSFLKSLFSFCGSSLLSRNLNAEASEKLMTLQQTFIGEFIFISNSLTSWKQQVLSRKLVFHCYKPKTWSWTKTGSQSTKQKLGMRDIAGLHEKRPLNNT